MRLLKFGSFSLPLWNKRDNVSMGNHGGAVSDLVGGGAYDSYGYGDAPERAHTISTTFEIIDTSVINVQKTRDGIRALAGTKERLYASFPDESLRFAWARLARVRMERRYDFIFYQPVELEFEIVSPGWRSATGWTLDDGENLDTGLLLDYNGSSWTPTATDYPLSVPTFGNRMVTDAQIVIVAGSDSISQIRVQCGSCDWTWKSTVPAGDMLTIDCGTRSVKLEGADAYTYMTLNAGHTVADWLQLQPGSNTVTISYTGNASGSALIAFSYLDNWA